MHSPAQLLAKEIQLLSELPPPAFPAESLHLITVDCVCGKRLPIKTQQVIDTGVIKVPDNFCPDCRRELGDYSHIVCVSCKRVVASCKPHKESDGFVYQRGRYYHTRSCPVCDTELRTTSSKVAIVERHLYRKKNNLPL